MQSGQEATASATVRKLSETYDGLDFDNQGRLAAGNKDVFLRLEHDPNVTLPAGLPNVVHAGFVYFRVPADVRKPTMFPVTSPWLSAEVCREGNALIPESDWSDDAEIEAALSSYLDEVYESRRVRQAAALLADERDPRAGLYASAARIEETTPMLIEGLLRERGVSVVYGDFDEFKTTVVLDMAAHVAMGAPWQGRTVKPRPIIWYALEGADEIPVRVRALEARLRKMDTPWGDDRMPITVLDRIPGDPIAWRAEVTRFAGRWDRLAIARETMGENVRYPDLGEQENRPIVVIDTLSLALGGDDERGPRAVGFINDCLDLLKERSDLACPFETTKDQEKWLEENPGMELWMNLPTASHVIVIHHQTKTGTDIAGHRGIGGNTHGLYRVHRFGKMTDARRPYAGQLTPMRVKGIPRPGPLRFEVDVVTVEGTKQTAAILKDKAAAIPEDLVPAIDALRELEDHERIELDDLNNCLDVVAASGGRNDAAKRKARQRSRETLETAGVIEPVQDDNGRVEFYRFHDSTNVNSGVT